MGFGCKVVVMKKLGCTTMPNGMVSYPCSSSVRVITGMSTMTSTTSSSTSIRDFSSGSIQLPGSKSSRRSSPTEVDLKMLSKRSPPPDDDGQKGPGGQCPHALSQNG